MLPKELPTLFVGVRFEGMEINGLAPEGAVCKVDNVEVQLETFSVREEGRQTFNSNSHPKESWSHVDSNGHYHAYAGKDTPTLRYKSGETYYCQDCRDDHSDSWLECIICEEKVVPQQTDGQTTIKGRMVTTLEVTTPDQLVRGAHSVTLTFDDVTMFGVMYVTDVTGTFSLGDMQIGSTLEGFLVKQGASK